MKEGYVRYTRILYDCGDKKRGLAFAAVLTALQLVSCVIIFSPYFEKILTGILVFVAIYGVVLLPIFTVSSWLKYVMCIGYLKRLRVYGYEIPVCKLDYRGLEELPRNRSVEPIRSGNSWESIALALICWGIAVGCMVGVFPLVLNYQMYGGIVFHGLVGLFWIVLGIGYFRQRSREKYKDDVEPETCGDEGEIKVRKMRTQLANGLVTIAVLLLFSTIFLIIIYNLGGVIYRARLAGGAGI